MRILAVLIILILGTPLAKAESTEQNTKRFVVLPKTTAEAPEKFNLLQKEQEGQEAGDLPQLGRPDAQRKVIKADCKLNGRYRTCF